MNGFFVGLVWETLEYRVFHSRTSLDMETIERKYCALIGPFATRAEAVAERDNVTASEAAARARQYAASHPHLTV